jgi:DNA-binding FadR family transcriptional regulator
MRSSRSGRLILAQGRIVDAVAADLVITGSADELARRLGVCVPTFRMALRELVAIGWIVVKEGPGGGLTVRWSGGVSHEPPRRPAGGDPAGRATL